MSTTDNHTPTDAVNHLESRTDFKPVLGTAALTGNPNEYKPGVIGEVTRSGTGNTILRVGHLLDRVDGWQQSEHVVLSPDERERLIKALILTRAAVHKAEPWEDDIDTGVSICTHCGETINKVPGGRGMTWVHSLSGAVAAKNIVLPRSWEQTPPTASEPNGAINGFEVRWRRPENDYWAVRDETALGPFPTRPAAFEAAESAPEE